MSSFASAFAGGLLIGLSAALFLLLDGRIAGISGLVAGLARPAGAGPAGEAWRTGFSFLTGLVLGPPVFALLAGGWPVMRIEASLPVLALAGLLVGFGTRLAARAAPPATGSAASPACRRARPWRSRCSWEAGC